MRVLPVPPYSKVIWDRSTTDKRQINDSLVFVLVVVLAVCVAMAVRVVVVLVVVVMIVITIGAMGVAVRVVMTVIMAMVMAAVRAVYMGRRWLTEAGGQVVRTAFCREQSNQRAIGGHQDIAMLQCGTGRQGQLRLAAVFQGDGLGRMGPVFLGEG